VVVLVGAGGWWAWGQRNPPELSGNPTEEFITTAAATTTTATPELAQNWPTYGYDNARTRWNPDLRHRPPFTPEWRFGARGLLEFPPAVADGLLYVGQIRGRFFAVNTENGVPAWRKDIGHCSAATPAVADGIVYASFLAEYPCPKGEFGSGGYVFAWDAKTGERRWVVELPPVESSPLVQDGTVYVGAWDKKVYALDAATGAIKWTTETDAQIVSSASWIDAASAGGSPAIVIGTNGGSLYALDAATGNRLWTTEAPGAVHGAPVLMNGLLYFSTCSRCGQNGVRGAKLGPDGIYAIDIETHRIVWSDREGKYSPLVADEKRVYLIGAGSIRGVTPR
jgi:outer membrane protein assembly factor BamB